MPAGRPKKMGVRKEKEVKEIFLKNLEKNLGIITPTIKATTNTSRFYYDRWLREDEDFKKKVDEIKDSTLDFVESKLYKLIQEGDKAAIIFYLKCKGKERGYIEVQRIEQETTFKDPIRINVIAPTQETIQIEGEDKKLLE